MGVLSSHLQQGHIDNKVLGDTELKALSMWTEIGVGFEVKARKPSSAVVATWRANKAAHMYFEL